VLDIADGLVQRAASPASDVDAQCDKLYGHTRWLNVDRCKYCQLSVTEDSLVYHIEHPPLSS